MPTRIKMAISSALESACGPWFMSRSRGRSLAAKSFIIGRYSTSDSSSMAAFWGGTVYSVGWLADEEAWLEGDAASLMLGLNRCEREAAISENIRDMRAACQQAEV